MSKISLELRECIYERALGGRLVTLYVVAAVVEAAAAGCPGAIRSDYYLALDPLTHRPPDGISSLENGFPFRCSARADRYTPKRCRYCTGGTPSTDTSALLQRMRLTRVAFNFGEGLAPQELDIRIENSWASGFELFGKERCQDPPAVQASESFKRCLLCDLTTKSMCLNAWRPWSAPLKAMLGQPPLASRLSLKTIKDDLCHEDTWRAQRSATYMSRRRTSVGSLFAGYPPKYIERNLRLRQVHIPIPERGTAYTPCLAWLPWYTTSYSYSRSPYSMVSVVSTALTKAVSELLLCGIYLVLFVVVIYFFRSGFMASKSRPLLLELGIVVQFLFIAAHLITSIVEMDSCLQSTVKTCFGSLDSSAAVANLAFFVLTSLITDMLVIQRLSVIWTHNRTVVYFPVFLLLVQAVGGVGVVVTVFISGKEGRATLLSLSNGWLTTTLVASLLISVYSSGMIYWRISRMVRWQASNSAAGDASGSGRLTSALAMMIESAAIQTWITALLLVFFESGLNAATVFTGIGPAMFGILTVLIHARVGLGWAKQAHDSTSGRSAGTVRLEPI
ncbi:hypothetical protein DFH08DRAFT_1023515 [Mycena albidolilacea]|uniref:Uncharacterized protein n=1 Tax=Mycena albidolilacea TaxID=1033008 RepID=A0AAD6ZN47_9AGAR|nr:hypothetical protein DFH08DRAFT_1023515 [Mycena albidolilacea]